MLKTLVAVTLFAVWLGVLTFIWWGFDPEGFWQKLVCTSTIVVAGVVLGAVAVFFGVYTFDEIDTMHQRKIIAKQREEQQRRQ